MIGVGRGQTYVWRGSGSTFSAHATWATGAPVLCRTVDPDGEEAPFCRGTTEEESRDYVSRVGGRLKHMSGVGASR